jgi:hypothetical protein
VGLDAGDETLENNRDGRTPRFATRSGQGVNAARPF